MADQSTSADQSTTTSLSGAPNESQRSPRRVLLWRWLGYFAVFAIAWHVTNFVSLDRAEVVIEKFPFIQVNTIVFVALLIHGGWRVVPAACAGIFVVLTALTCIQYLGGDLPTAKELWEGAMFCAPFGIATGGMALKWQRDHGKQWKAVAIFLQLYGLVTAGLMLSFLSSAIADEIGRSSVR